jgi:aerobic-type carbon monoxide dehydrogenase small subunit (CoxS/CutS family)
MSPSHSQDLGADRHGTTQVHGAKVTSATGAASCPGGMHGAVQPGDCNHARPQCGGCTPGRRKDASTTSCW